jgi:hypothetical protein
VFISGELLLFRSRAIPALLAALCLRTSATTPTPHNVLLKTKTKVQFDWTVDRAVEALFPVFHGSNRGQFQPCFPVFTVRSAEGYKNRNAFGWMLFTQSSLLIFQ